MTDLLYSTTATASGGGDGRVSSTDDDRLSIELSVQGELGGDDGPGTNPEQLFAAGYAACFLQALEGVARLQHLDVGDWSVSVTVSLSGHLDEGMDLAAHVEATLPGVDEGVAKKLLETAYAACPYSRATRGNLSQDVVLAGGA